MPGDLTQNRMIQSFSHYEDGGREEETCMYSKIQKEVAQRTLVKEKLVSQCQNQERNPSNENDKRSPARNAWIVRLYQTQPLLDFQRRTAGEEPFNRPVRRAHGCRQECTIGAVLKQSSTKEPARNSPTPSA